MKRLTVDREINRIIRYNFNRNTYQHFLLPSGPIGHASMHRLHHIEE